MYVPGIHPPDPNDPKGMAWVFAAGFADPRPGYPNQALVLKQSWEPTSQMWWDLGLRWHPELQTKWIKGGGQFGAGEIVDAPPEEKSLQELAEEMAAEQFAQMKAEVDRVREHGSEWEKERLRQRFKMAGEQAKQMAEMLDQAADSELKRIEKEER
ncbi:minor tail protein [Mycobacterium phage Azrael100]|uniref:Minor tail protein n=1 Tax=Mycobacterium phage Cosmo TaxID=1567467 RepID=A0A0B5A2V4_9CAUD|nr:hypothetical protein COSMO_42 [Mycobacterium phage Cosmo]WKR36052.1 minor tail protein [Mycobacterium phage Azrael100]